MYKKILFVVGAVVIGLGSSTAKAGIVDNGQCVSPPTEIQSLADFDISSEVNTLLLAMDARQDYEAVKEKMFDQVRMRRLEQYRNVRIHVYCIATALTEELFVRPNGQKGYRVDGYVRIDCPYPGLKVVNGSGRCAEIARNVEFNRCYAENLSCENNGYKVRLHIESELKYHRSYTIQLHADYAYDDAKLTELINRDMEVLKDRILQTVLKARILKRL